MNSILDSVVIQLLVFLKRSTFFFSKSSDSTHLLK